MSNPSAGLGSSSPAKAYLVGMMGSGKTSVGRVVAGALGWDFEDLDEAVSREAGSSIAEIWDREGEAGFRAREAAVLESLASSERPMVVACGGGVVTQRACLELLEGSGRCVYLKASPRVLANRLWRRARVEPAELSGRPLLKGVSNESELERRLAELLEAREELYRKAAAVEIDVDGLTTEEVAAEVVKRLRHLDHAALR